MKSFVIMGRIFKAAYEELFLCVFMSLAWCIGTLLILPAAPVTMGIHQVANRMANYKRVDNSFFWEATRRHIGHSWLLYAFNLLLPGIIGASMIFYLQASGWIQFLGFVCMWLLLYAFMLGQYIFPLYWQQEDRNLKLVLRNAALLTLQYPLYTFLMLIFQLVLIGVSVALTLPVFLLTPALIAISANFALTGMLQEMGLADPPPEVPKR